MTYSSGIRLYALAMVLVFGATPAFAQFQPRSLDDPATGEKFIVEGAAGFWIPNADLLVRSAAFGLAASNIDAKEDLGLTNHSIPELHLVLRPARKHKLRFQFIPIKYDKEVHRL